LTVAYEETGPRTGLPVILLHGFPDSARTWDRVAPPLAAAGMRVFVPDLRGYGATRIHDPVFGGAQQAALARDVVEFADALNLREFGLIGHDWGCRAACGASVLAPGRVRGVVAIDGYILVASREPGRLYPPALEREYWYQWYFATERGGRALREQPEAVCAELQRSWTPAGKPAPFPETFEAFANDQFADVVLHSYRHRHGWAADVPAYSADEDVLAQRPPVTAPSFVLLGAADPLTGGAQFVEGREHFTQLVASRVIEGAGHFVQRDAPEAVVEAARTLFDGA
jgi:pimeloyl-ACP methyl ester carboxylesterase